MTFQTRDVVILRNNVYCTLPCQKHLAVLKPNFLRLASWKELQKGLHAIEKPMSSLSFDEYLAICDAEAVCFVRNRQLTQGFSLLDTERDCSAAWCGRRSQVETFTIRYYMFLGKIKEHSKLQIIILWALQAKSVYTNDKVQVSSVLE